MLVAFTTAALAAPTVQPTGPLVPGVAATLSIGAADPGSEIRVYASTLGTGQGPCVQGACLQLLSPLEVGRAVADAQGTALLPVTVPAAAPYGPIWLEAAQATPPLAAGPTTETAVVPPVKVLMVGDSITEGQQSQPADLPYWQVTADDLGPAYEVVSIGCGGATSSDWEPGGPTTLCGGQWWSPNVYEARATPELPAEVVTVMLGTNDATGFFEPAPLPPVEYAGNVVALVDQLLADGAGTVMLLTPPPMCATTDPAVVDRLRAYRAIDLYLCTHRAGVVCGPDVYTLLGPADFRGCDVHPNGQGHRILGEAVADAIRAL